MDRPLGGPRAKRGPAPQKTPDGAPKGATLPQGGVTLKDSRANWRAVPLAFCEGRQKTQRDAGTLLSPATGGADVQGLPGADTKNTGNDARLENFIRSSPRKRAPRATSHNFDM